MYSCLTIIRQSARLAAGVLLIFLIGIPVCFAGGALTIIKDEKQFAPRGSYIPERRVEKILKKVEEHKAAMKEKQGLQRKTSPPATETPEDK